MANTIPEIIEQISPYYKSRAGKKAKGVIDSVAEVEHKLVYDSSSETLEPIYFFILDLMNDFGLKPEKFVDNFTSSPGSGHFSELGTKATAMQQQASQTLGNINTVLRSVLNLLYDLKEFKIRLQSYDDLNSKDSSKSEGAKLSLKQLWMDKVDINKGNSSIKAMALGQAGFTTLLDAFLAAKDEKDIDNIDLNDRVKRILKMRVNEFNTWLSQSEVELRKRYEIERNYLKSQHNSLKLYTRWAKPYLVAASQLEQKDLGRDSAMVKTFNTIILELTLLGKSEIKMRDLAMSGDKDIPKELAKETYLKKMRPYYSCVLVDFKFRGIPQKISQQSHFAFGGRAEITFRAYALNKDELEKLIKEFDKSDINDALRLIEGVTGDSLKQLQDEIDSFLNEVPQEKKSEKAKFGLRDLFEPFSALFGAYDEKPKVSDKEKEKSKEDKPVVPDNWFEKEYARKAAAETSKETSLSLFDIYKKSHGMASFT